MRLGRGLGLGLRNDSPRCFAAPPCASALLCCCCCLMAATASATSVSHRSSCQGKLVRYQVKVGK